MNIPIPSGKEIFDLLKGAITIEAQEKIMQLRQAALDIQEENLTLRQQLAAAEKRLELRDLPFDGAVYWSTLPDKSKPRDPANGPFCPRCLDADSKRVRLQEWRDRPGRHGWHCEECKRGFTYGFV